MRDGDGEYVVPSLCIPSIPSMVYVIYVKSVRLENEYFSHDGQPRVAKHERPPHIFLGPLLTCY